MRNTLSKEICKLAVADKKIIFITGDLGFNAFEELKVTLGDRFINAGVAEQNLIGVAAGLAYKGYRVFCYSIAPFITYRCLEQIRIDVCFHKLPVFIVGNGGGYGYGIMGATHHALEDIACMSSMPNMNTYLPASSSSLQKMLTEVIENSAPAYLRLGNSIEIEPHENAVNPSLYIFAAGNLYLETCVALKDFEQGKRIAVFALERIPCEDFLRSIGENVKGKKVLVLEEHTARGGVGEYLSRFFLTQNIVPRSFIHKFALGYPNEKYGDQMFHRKQSGLDAEGILKTIKDMLN